MRENAKNLAGIGLQNAGKGTLRKKLYRHRYCYFMLLPALIIVSLFVYKPIMYWIIAFKDYKIGGSIYAGSWAGLEYFREFFQDSTDAYYVFRNTLSFNIVSLILSTVASMAFAILLSEIRHKKLQRFIQSASIFPYFVSWVIAYSFCRAFFATGTGLVNTVLMNAGIIKKGYNILGDPQYTFSLLIGVNLWKGLGYSAVIYLATIAGIDQEQYEAADIDGAGRLAKIRYITIPSLAGTMAILLVLNSGWLLSSNFDMFYQFSNPTNQTVTEVFDMYVYRYGLKLGRYSYATAVGIFKTVTSLVIVMLSNIVYRKTMHRSIF
ncbi:MAG TPA: sugar ABC transporter permease [Candidatus Ornithocaccomicrobium faecavium]|uniref:Sugar ABC transporter permease n=1 Tax=Candidatus Ornithocaccomicrobium faecavium TaxID=2840890 RepID=A0A9D1P576_9FIRM|nr:sugar ABC transporter permease [Candidatus Ornithocaccomicrobium faecavium]